MSAWLLVYTFPAERTKQAACLMHECLPSKLPNFDWNTKWAHWPPKDIGPWRLFRIQSLTSSWQDSLPTGLRLHYKAADNSKAPSKCPHRQQWHALFYPFSFYWPHIIHTLPHSHQSYLGVMGACHDVLRRPCVGSTAAQPSAGIMTVWVNVVQQSFPRVSVTKITRATSHHCVLFYKSLLRMHCSAQVLQ